MNIGLALKCRECTGILNGISGVCAADEEGISINCAEDSCVKAECSTNGYTVIVRTCGSPNKTMKAGIDTKSSACVDGVRISSQSQV